MWRARYKVNNFDRKYYCLEKYIKQNGGSRIVVKKKKKASEESECLIY